MKITRDLVIVLSYIILICLVSSKAKFRESVNSRRANMRANQNKNVLKFGGEAFPQPLPTESSPYVLSPHKTIYQGIRYENDTRVFRKRFEFEAMLTGHQIVCQGLFDCIISHIAIESTEATPVLLRGGAGYRHFTAIIKAKPGHELKGQVRAYCRSHYAPIEQPQTSVMPRRRFYFGDILEDEDLMGL